MMSLSIMVGFRVYTKLQDSFPNETHTFVSHFGKMSAKKRRVEDKGKEEIKGKDEEEEEESGR